MTDFPGLLRLLVEGDVRFILVGGVAATVHGSARQTQDVDVVYARDDENIRALAGALEGEEPRLRGAPDDLPFVFDEETVRRGLNFTLATRLGALDLFGEIAGGGSYESLLPHTIEIDVFGLRLRCLDLPTLIRTKRAAGRPKDLETLAELEAIRDEQQSGLE